MSIFYDTILEMKYGLNENQIIHINTIDGEEIIIKPHHKICCFDGILIIRNKETTCKIIQLQYIVSVGLYTIGGKPVC